MVDTRQTIDIPNLAEKARQLRLDILDMTTQAGSGHPSSSFSAVEILVALFFSGILRHRPGDPWWPGRDRFIMSKGHAAPLLYAVLAAAGYFPRQELWRLRQIDSPVQGHPIQGLLPGVEATTGSLGQGLSVGLGHVLGGRLNKLDYRVYVLIGDGECQAGQVWEAAMAAAHFKADRLTAILDYNKYQQTGPVDEVMPALKPIAEKWRAFGWHVREIDGHNVSEILEALDEVRQVKDRPQMIIASTLKGKGLSPFEADDVNRKHGEPLTEEEKQIALAELDEMLQRS